MVQPVYRIKRIFLEKASAFLIYQPGHALLVDCGPPHSELKILEIMKRLDLDPGDLKLLILTHSHFDHAGSARSIRSQTGCKVIVHQADAGGLQKGFTSIPPGTRWKAKVLAFFGSIFARWIMSYPGTEPDIVTTETYPLAEFGFPALVIHTPGHTLGSQVVLLEGGELIAGDTLSGVAGKEHFPPFAEDLPALLRSWEDLSKHPIEIIYPAHGRPFNFRGFLSELDLARKKYGSK